MAQQIDASPWHSGLVRVSNVACACVGLIGITVLLGWTFDFETLKRLKPGMVAMNPATAVGFILCASALWFNTKGLWRRLGSLCAMIAATIGALAALERLLLLNFVKLVKDVTNDIVIDLKLDISCFGVIELAVHLRASTTW